jgi:hypothetical protein
MNIAEGTLTMVIVGWMSLHNSPTREPSTRPHQSPGRINVVISLVIEESIRRAVDDARSAPNHLSVGAGKSSSLS